MEERQPTRLPIAWAGPDPEWVWSDICAAIGLVAAGVAERITITNVEVSAEMAGRSVALAQQAGVGFALERDDVTGRRAVRVGPRR